MMGTFRFTKEASEQRYALEQAMDFGHVIRSHGDGTFEDYGDETEQGVRADEVLYVDLDENGGAGEPNLFGSGFSDGWSLLSGFSGQYGYSGPTMHESEYIGGGLADHILTTPGLWVAVIVDGMEFSEDGESSETVNVGWAILHYEGEDI